MFLRLSFFQPSSGKSDHQRSRQLVPVLAHQPAERRQQGRLQRQLRLEAGECPSGAASTSPAPPPLENPDGQLSWERLHHAAPAVRNGCRFSSPPVPASVPSVRPEKFVFVGGGGELAAEQQNGPSRAFVCLLTFSRFGRRGNITFDSGRFCLLLLEPLEPEPNHANGP